MKVLLAVLLCWINPAHAQDWWEKPTLTPVIVAKASGILRNPSLHSLCRRMPGNHLADIESLERAYQELSANVDQADKVSELVREIKEISSRIRFLANPEWNSENIPVEINWKIPNSFFFDDSEFLRLKDSVRDAPFGKSKDFAQYFQAMLKRPSITEKKLISAEFLNSANTDIARFLNLAPWTNDSEYETDRSFTIRLAKNVTALEACQFLNTMLFEVRISYGQRLPILDTWYESEQTIFLIYRNEDASAK